jgi:copper chaperone CopZ
MKSQKSISNWSVFLSVVLSLGAVSAWSCGEEEGQTHAQSTKSKGHSLILTAHADDAIQAAPGTKTAVFQVKGMSCGSCERHIRTALEAVGGVKMVEFKKSGKTNLMNVAYLPEKVTAEQIMKAVPSDYTVTVK